MISVTNANSKHAAVTLFVARCFMASLFVFSGLEKVFDFSGAVLFAQAHGVLFAETLMPVVILLELGASLMLVTGWRASQGALALTLWVLWTGPWFHRFWMAPPHMWQMMIDDFFHHFVMAGGLLYVVIFGDIILDVPNSIS